MLVPSRNVHLLGDLSPLWVPVSRWSPALNSTQLNYSELISQTTPTLFRDTTGSGLLWGSYLSVQKCSVTVLLEAAELARAVDPTSFPHYDSRQKSPRIL